MLFHGVFHEAVSWLVDECEWQVGPGSQLEGIEIAFVVCCCLLVEVSLQEGRDVGAVDGWQRLWQELAQLYELV